MQVTLDSTGPMFANLPGGKTTPCQSINFDTYPGKGLEPENGGGAPGRGNLR